MRPTDHARQGVSPEDLLSKNSVVLFRRCDTIRSLLALTLLG
jgi:hypothetical protein